MGSFLMLAATLARLAGAPATTTTLRGRGSGARVVRGGQGRTALGEARLASKAGHHFARTARLLVGLARQLEHLLQGLALVRLHSLLHVRHPLATLAAGHVCDCVHLFVLTREKFLRATLEGCGLFYKSWADATAGKQIPLTSIRKRRIHVRTRLPK